ncbi:hypothetical protein EV207_108100 [Scopulibacillus darangshiensis]|uniref:Methionine/alanine importer small subunit n=1 Tax=Scopulibacillus darangshiensis TaxID=442528 RepID=A0A4R2P6F4_9BACL|nr:MetS family NSS transporter small subunit [Scopulibacillus darangshiensis]TCP29808.1 hypothetical protein EV207_108100 [Scopulibacillus darangshiensis]
MSGSAITIMVIGMIILWGGFGASVAHAVSVSRKAKKQQQ